MDPQQELEQQALELEGKTIRAFKALFVTDGRVEGDALLVLDYFADYCGYDRVDDALDATGIIRQTGRRDMITETRRILAIPLEVVRENDRIIRVMKQEAEDARED